jgi:hypothetical protein
VYSCPYYSIFFLDVWIQISPLLWLQRGKVKLVLSADTQAEFLGWYSTLEKILTTLQVTIRHLGFDGYSTLEKILTTIQVTIRHLGFAGCALYSGA